MTNKGALLLLFLLLPTWARAHGEEVFVPVYIQAASVLLFLLAIVLVRLPYPTKALLVGVYLLTTLLVWLLTATLPFRENASLINLLVGIVPVANTLAALGITIILKQRQAKRPNGGN